MKEFAQVGAMIEQRWGSRNYLPAEFPEIAAEALAEARLHERVRAAQVLDWALRESVLPDQKDLHGRFGDPPITVFNGSRFHIDVYFWYEGLTSIHEHGFAGAFQVLSGSSIHGWYNFDEKEKITHQLAFGELELKSCELLSVGDIQRILPGPEYIHSLFHIDYPSATIVIRTPWIPEFLPQMDYRKPRMAVDPFYSDPHLTKKVQVLSAVYRSDPQLGDRRLEEWLAEADLLTSYLLLLNFRDNLANDRLRDEFGMGNLSSRFERMLVAIGQKHGGSADQLRETIEFQTKIDAVVGLRRVVKDPEHRFLLALLMNVEGVDRVLELVSSRFPDSDARSLVLNWVTELSESRIVGSHATNALGIEGFGEIENAMFEALLNGAQFDGVVEFVTAEFGMSDPDLEDLRLRFEKIVEAPVFFRLFTSGR